MEDTPKKGIDLKLAFISLLMLIIPTCIVAYYISPLNMPINASGQGEGIDQLILYVHILMGALFVGWIGYFFYVLLRYRKSHNPKADYEGVKSHASSVLEAVVAVVEAALLIGLAVPIWAKTVDTFPKPSESTVIKVIAQQFQWNGWYPGPDGVFCAQNIKYVSGDNPFGFDKNDPHYKQNFTVAKDLVVPVNKPALIFISSLDVIHCFACRPMRVTQDAIPGMVFPAHFTPTQTGTYLINCAQLCGVGHYSMRGTLKVVSAEDYAKWVASKSTAGGGGGGYE